METDAIEIKPAHYVVMGILVLGLGAWVVHLVKKKGEDKDVAFIDLTNPSSKTRTVVSDDGTADTIIDLDSSDPLNPDFEIAARNMAGSNLIVLKKEKAKELATKIKDAWSWFNDDEEAIYTVFRSLKDKVQVSQVSAAYKGNLKSDLTSKLDKEDELSVVLEIIQKLPNYRT